VSKPNRVSSHVSDYFGLATTAQNMAEGVPGGDITFTMDFKVLLSRLFLFSPFGLLGLRLPARIPAGSTLSFSAQKTGQHSLLGVQAVLRLIKDHGVFAPRGLVGDFLPVVGGKAMHH